MDLTKPVYIIVKTTDEGFEPVWQGGRTTKHAIRAFDDLLAAQRSLYYLKGQLQLEDQLSVIKVNTFELVDIQK